LAEGGLREVEALNPRWGDFNALDQSANEEVLRGSKVTAPERVDVADQALGSKRPLRK
jgi:hypothetical protein